MLGLIKFLVWFIIISYILRLLGRNLFPFLLKRYIRKKQSQFNQQFNKANHQEEDGKVTINKKAKDHKSNTDNMGEYVDFEEVDD